MKKKGVTLFLCMLCWVAVFLQGAVAPALAETPIFDIQTTADPSGDSPRINQVVTTEGIVTAVFYNSYFIEDPAGGPWSGIYVYDAGGPAIGDRLSITGTVAEYYGLTQLKDLTDYSVLSSGNPVPAPVVLATADVSQESYEGVLIRVEGVTVTDDDLGYGEWSVSDGSGDVVIDDKGSYAYVPSTGDSLAAVTGPLDYSYGAFKIQPRNDGDVSITQPIPLVINEIRIDQPGLDNHEYFELAGTPGASLNGLTYIVIGDGTGGSGVVEAVVDLSGQVMPAGGFFVAAESTFTLGAPDLVTSLNFENSDNVTHLLVEGYTGAIGDDLDTDDDGVLDVTPWDRVVDLVGIVEEPNPPGTTEFHYGPPSVGPDGNYVPGHVYRCEDGWYIGQFDLGSADTPGSANDCGASLDACGDPATMIHAIQGSGDASPMAGETGISIEGVVTGDFQDTTTGLNGFFVQEETADADDDPETSDGIFVYDNGFDVDVSVGDIVRVTGEVVEFNGMTELSEISAVQICSSGSAATPVEVELPVTALGDWERYEGMLITIPQTLHAVDNYNLGRYGEVGLASGGRLDVPTNVAAPGDDANELKALNDLRRIQLDDGSNAQNPDPVPFLGLDNTLRAGDIVEGLTGVLGYGYGVYEIHPTAPIDFYRANDREALPPPVGGSLKVTSFNVLNYFSTVDEGLPACGPSSDQDCRGADTQDELVRQRDKIVAAILAMDADVVGLIEMENHPGDAALMDLVNGLNHAAGPGIYSYIQTGPIGADAIKIALIYKPETVAPIGDFAILDSSVDANFNDTKNRPALAQTFGQLSTGEKLTVVVNHLKSKGSDCVDVGDPDAGDGQGNCNLTRTAAVNAIAAWLASDPTASSDPDFLIIGDLNAYAMEDPIAALKNQGYVDLIDAFLGPGAYTYVYQGEKGYLDHALASEKMSRQVKGVATWHINADEPVILDYNDTNPVSLYAADPYRSSDHDPVIVGLDLLSVAMDIKPGSCKNPVNTRSQGVLPVAVLGKQHFDVKSIDPASIRLNVVAPLRWAYEDVTAPGACDEQPDGHLDLVLKFETQAVIASLGEIEDGDVLTLGLSGNFKPPHDDHVFVSEDIISILKKGQKDKKDSQQNTPAGNHGDAAPQADAVMAQSRDDTVPMTDAADTPRIGIGHREPGSSGGCFVTAVFP